MWAWCWEPVSPEKRANDVPASTRMRRRSGVSGAVSCRSISPAWRRWSGATGWRSVSILRPTLRARCAPRARLYPQSARRSTKTARGMSGARARRCARIAKSMNGYKVIVDKSTISVGRPSECRGHYDDETTLPFSVANNPFLKQGAAVEDFLKPDRVVIGVEDDRARGELMVELYGPFTRTGAPIMVMDRWRAAQLWRYAAKPAILATRISFMKSGRERLAASRARCRPGAQSHRRRSSHRLVVPVSRLIGSAAPVFENIKALIKFPATMATISRTSCTPSEARTKPRKCASSQSWNQFRMLRDKTIAVWGLWFKPRT